ncbi:MAG: aryl-sulfate sulfotransferase [Flavobacteriaceae bacterium]|nr:aryl-sulfate sulfotransferase [Flavobacteriaceae bacterium]
MASRKTYASLNFLILLLFILSSCSDSDFKYSVRPVLNPNGNAPLTAILNVSANQPYSATVKVLGETEIEQSYGEVSDNFSVPVLGLYPNRTNLVVLNLQHENGQTTDTIRIPTAPLPNHFPIIEVNKVNREKMEPGLHMADTHFANFGEFLSAPIIFDDEGQVRWYLDLSFEGKMLGPFQKLKDGYILVGGRHKLYKYDMLGKRVKTMEINPYYGMHHDIVELPNGQLLIPIGTRDANIEVNGETIVTDSDFIMLFDPETSRIVKQWDMAKHLDVIRDEMDYFKQEDWLHMNGLAFVEKDSSIIVSGRNQGIAKISWNDELKWILSPKQGWGKAGRNMNGINTNEFLLTAVNKDGEPYPKDVQAGKVSPEDFDFSWGPHAPKLLPNGNLILFDTGAYRNFGHENRYSRAVEYAINEGDKTVKQIWQYGKERGDELYSMIVSDVDYLPQTENILVTAGYLTPKTNHSGKIVEVDPDTNEEVFEATLYFKTISGDKSPKWGQTDILYRSERMKLEY